MEPFGFNKEKASQTLAKHGIDVLVVSTPVNVFYTTGIPVIHVAPNPILFVLYNQFPTLSLVRNDGEESLIAWILYQSTKKFSWVTDVDGIASPKAAMENVAKKIEQQIRKLHNKRKARKHTDAAALKRKRQETAD